MAVTYLARLALLLARDLGFSHALGGIHLHGEVSGGGWVVVVCASV